MMMVLLQGALLYTAWAIVEILQKLYPPNEQANRCSRPRRPHALYPIKVVKWATAGGHFIQLKY